MKGRVFMKIKLRSCLCLLLGLVMLVSLLCACGKAKKTDGITLNLQENGTVTWEPVEGADHYLISLDYPVGEEHFGLPDQRTYLTEIRLYSGMGVSVTAIMPDGSRGLVSNHITYGESDPALHDAVLQGRYEDLTVVLDPEALADYVAVELPESDPEYSHLVRVDENGLFSWDSFGEGYIYDISRYYLLDGISVTNGLYSSTDPDEIVLHSIDDRQLQLNPGETAWLTVRDPSGTVVTEQILTNSDDGLFCADVIGGILPETVQQDGDLLTFSSQFPDGQVIRFEAEHMSYENGTLTASSNAKLTMLDSPGQLLAVVPSLSSGGFAGGIHYSGGYSFDGLSSVESASQLDFLISKSGSGAYSFDAFYPNFLRLEFDLDGISLSGLTCCYQEGGLIPLAGFEFWEEMHRPYLPGEYYDAKRESSPISFYLRLLPGSPDATYDGGNAVYSTEHYTVGDLKDANGNVISREDPLPAGATVEVTVGPMTLDLPLTTEPVDHIATHHARDPMNTPEAVGEINALLVPISYAGNAMAPSEALLQQIRGAVGNVLDDNGNVTDHSIGEPGSDSTSLSDYYAAVSFGKLNLSTYITDWYPMDRPYDPNLQLNEYDAAAIRTWLMETYPDKDWSAFDQDGNGIFDAVIFIGNGDSALFDGALSRPFQTDLGGDPRKLVGTAAQPDFCNFLAVELHYLYRDAQTEMPQSSSLIHEFGHTLGLPDYYEAVTSEGIDALGSYDMHASSAGDWNAYSKFSVGWIEPTVVDEAAFGGKDSVEYTIRSSPLSGDALLIPAAGSDFNGTAFDEYIMVDLFTIEGMASVNADYVGFPTVSEDTAGVRIYHVNGSLVHREQDVGDFYEYFTTHYDNNYHKYGCYEIELIQAGGTNTFTAGGQRTYLLDEDLFTAEQTFTTEAYREFFRDGRMDDGSEFGYRITVVSIDQDANGEYTATVRIEKE